MGHSVLLAADDVSSGNGDLAEGKAETLVKLVAEDIEIADS